MASRARILSFLVSVTQLPSFPLFCIYLLVLCLSGVYRRMTKPLEIRQVMVAYNLLCSTLSACTFVGFCYGLLHAEHLYYKEWDHNLHPVFTAYWVLKTFELLDTVFMIIRHKTQQISFLHVFHHSTMLVLSDYARLLTPWPAIAPILTLNSAVHVLLYLYYGLAAMYPDNPPQWKKFVTQFQITQFVFDLLFALFGYLYHGFCIYGILYGLVMTYLFCSFYYLSYIKKKFTKSKSS